MKVGRKPPEERTLLVKTGQNEAGDAHEYDLYVISPVKVAQLRWDGKLSWYTEDGMRFQGAQSAIDYVQREIVRSGTVLQPGRYRLDYESVEQQEDRLVIKTKDGQNIVIQSGESL